jgi:hypothetical protein
VISVDNGHINPIIIIFEKRTTVNETIQRPKAVVRRPKLTISVYILLKFVVSD